MRARGKRRIFWRVPQLTITQGSSPTSALRMTVVRDMRMSVAAWATESMDVGFLGWWRTASACQVSTAMTARVTAVTMSTGTVSIGTVPSSGVRNGGGVNGPTARSAPRQRRLHSSTT